MQAKLTMEFDQGRFAVLLPHIELALTQSLLSNEEIIELVASECVRIELIERLN